MNEQFNKSLELNWSIKQDWWKLLKSKVAKNKSVIQKMADDTSAPLNYYAAYAQVRKI